MRLLRETIGTIKKVLSIMEEYDNSIASLRAVSGKPQKEIEDLLKESVYPPDHLIEYCCEHGAFPDNPQNFNKKPRV